MKIYLRKNHEGEIYDGNIFAAYLGYKDKNELAFYQSIHGLDDYNPFDIVIGTDVDIRWFFRSYGITLPNLDYPEELHSFLGRKIWTSTLFTITNEMDYWHIFIKPRKETKRFRGTVLDETYDLVKLGGLVNDIEIWCSEKIAFLSEWRAYVLDGEVLGLYPYKGDWQLFPDADIITKAVKAYTKAPRGYAIDFGVDDNHRTLLVEVNDGYGLNNYGLPAEQYCKILSARWLELTKDLSLPDETERESSKENK